MTELLTSWGHGSGDAERPSREEPLSASRDSSEGEALAVNAAVADLVALTGNHGVLGDFDDIDAMPPDALQRLADDSGPYWSTNTARVVLQLGHDSHGALLPEAQAATVAWLEQRNDEDLRRLDELIGPKSLAVLVASEALVQRLPARLLTRLVASLPSAARISLLGTLASVRVGTASPDHKGTSLGRPGRA